MEQRVKLILWHVLNYHCLAARLWKVCIVLSPSTSVKGIKKMHVIPSTKYRGQFFVCVYATTNTCLVRRRMTSVHHACLSVTVNHLLDCPANPTTLSVDDLWENPRAVADFLRLLSEFGNLPPPASPPPPHCRLPDRPPPSLFFRPLSLSLSPLSSPLSSADSLLSASVFTFLPLTKDHPHTGSAKNVHTFICSTKQLLPL